MRNCLESVKANEKNPKWNQIVKRDSDLYSRETDIRTDFERDYTRIINSLAFRRMKHKTQVFFSPTNDHVCTRLEHVILVESISHTISDYLGLNLDLTKAIAMSHDIGHSPFGHKGEAILSKISQRDIGRTFWHERNGMEIVDKIVLLEDNEKNMRNLDLTYAVKDGIISHCGEIDENSLKPREEAINLYDYNYPNEYKPYTWEGCSVKIADKIAYLGRDIQDAVRLGILDEHLKELHEVMGVDEDKVINNTVIINYLIYDLCENTSLEEGFKFSDDAFNFINNLKEFNYKYIYNDERLKPSNAYFELVINTIYETLKRYYGEKEHIKKMYPEIIKDFEDWLKLYWNKERPDTCKNKVVFNTSDEKEFCQAIIYYISGMTDNYAISTYNKIIRF
jgi:dGTPase